MPRRLSNQVLRLIAKRAYAAGDLEKAMRAVSRCEAALRGAHEDLASAQAKVAALDSQIRALEPELNPEDIAARRLTPRVHEVPHGAIIKTIVQSLRDAGPDGVASDVLKAALLLAYPADQSTPTQRRKTRRAVMLVLHALKRKGAIQQLDDTVGASGAKVTRWAWIAN